MRIDYAVQVEKGKKDTNDDRSLINQQIIVEGNVDGSFNMPGIAVICDGCGGYAGGEIAASTVLEVLQNESAKDLLDEENLQEALGKCQKAVMEKREENRQVSCMCTTIAGCVFSDERTMIFHAGDTRIYRFDGQFLAQMTIDHSAVQEMLNLGQITEEEAKISPARHIINRCIGEQCLPPDIYISRNPIAPGEKYLICSDGLWESITREKMIEILRKDIPLRSAAEELVHYAIEHGSEDNISVCICAREGDIATDKKDSFVLD